MLKERVVKAGDGGNDRCVRVRDDFYGDRIERMDFLDIKVRSRRVTYSLARTTHRLEHCHSRLPHAMRIEKFGKLARRRAVPGERQDTHAGL